MDTENAPPTSQARWVLDTSSLEGHRFSLGQIYVICSKHVPTGCDPEAIPPRIAVAQGHANLRNELDRLRAEAARTIGGQMYVHAEAAIQEGGVFVVDDGE